MTEETVTVSKALLREILSRFEKIERILSGKDKEGSPHALRAVLNRSLSKEPLHAKSYLGVDLEEVVTRIFAEKKQKATKETDQKERSEKHD